jgi:hypothetical protein
MVARFQPIETGIRSGDRVEIVAGLREGARVITMGAGALRDGDRVVPATGGERSGERGADRPGRGTGSDRAPASGTGSGSGRDQGAGQEQAQRDSRPEGNTR